MRFRFGVALIVLASALAGLAGVQGGPGSFVVHAQTNSSCSGTAYKPGQCVSVPAQGQFSVKVPKGGVKLVGNGSPKYAGTTIVVSNVTVAGAPKHAKVFKVTASGPIPPLTSKTKGTLYQYNPATGTWKKVTSVKAGGIYAFVPGK